MFEVPFWHWCLVLSAEDADLEILQPSAGVRFEASIPEVVKVLIDDFLGIDVLGNVLPCLPVGDELPGIGKVNTVLFSEKV